MVYRAYRDWGANELMILLIVIVIIGLIAQFSLIEELDRKNKIRSESVDEGTSQVRKK